MSLPPPLAALSPFLEQLNALLARQPVRLAIEGGSASGKTTLAAWLQQTYDAAVFHMDDFFLRPEQRTAARLNEPGGNVDRERFAEEVLHSLCEGRPVVYRRFDCKMQTLSPPITVEPRMLTIVEGAYSMHPALADAYDLSLFLDVDPARQRQRIQNRNTKAEAQRFFEHWIPLENRYFDACNVRARCTCVLTVNE